MAKSECSSIAAYTGGLEGQVCSLAYELAATWRRPIFIQVTRVNYCNGFAVDDTTVNITLIVIIFALLLLLLVLYLVCL